MTDKTKVYNMNCMDGMREYPDKYFDLAITDPPYANDLNGGRSSKNGWNEKIDWDKATKGWNLSVPSKDYFNELQRVSNNQIIWGGNYFANLLPPSQCWLVWDKGQREFSLADAELAWSSFDSSVRVKTIHRSVANQEERFHPTQKPVALYKWLLKNYAKEGDKILDSHLGSGSSRIAAFDMGFDFTGYELDKDYFEAAEKRFQQHKAQLKFDFSPGAAQ